MRVRSILAAAIGLCAPLLGCNAVLGIDSASLAPDASDASSGTDAPGSTTDDDPLTCANYCKVVNENCTGEYVEYLTSEGDAGANNPCMYLCTHYLIRNPGTYAPPNGPEPMATSGQPATLACRLWHAHAAGSMPQSIHCRHAGPLGSEACGDPCAAFCSLDFSYCVDDNAVSTYASQSQCQAACLGAAAPDASAPDAGFVYNDTVGDLVDNSGVQINSGNTLNCRLWHLETSIQENMPDPHCWHTASPSENPGGAPGGPCSN